MEASNSIDPKILAAICLVISVPVAYYWMQSDSNKNKKTGSTVPDAVGRIPLLGNALQYKESPTDCIRHQESATKSKLFRINMAGRKMIIVGSDPELQKTISNQPESVMSSRKAVAEIGFEYTLGTLNVYEGTDWHKTILKNYVQGKNFQDTFLPNMFEILSQSLDTELQLAEGTRHGDMMQLPDLFHFVRRIVLRATLDLLVSPALLEQAPELVDEFMEFQDQVEDATAKAAVLPRFLALPACLWKTQRARFTLQTKLATLLPSIYTKDDNTLGPWLETYQRDKTPPETAAEHLIGLIFAAHKNPSIGASQCLCLLRTQCSAQQQLTAQKEAKTVCHLLATSPKNGVAALLEATTLRAVVLETMRLTAHTIGALRKVQSTLEVGNHTIAEGETVAIAHHTMHMNQELWGQDCDKFLLDRNEWTSSTSKNDSDISPPVDQYKFTTFSNGVHKCPGEKVALAMMEILLAMLLERDAQFINGTGEADASSLPPLSFERATLAQREEPCAFQIRK